jgi:hypothetical protein
VGIEFVEFLQEIGDHHLDVGRLAALLFGAEAVQPDESLAGTHEKPHVTQQTIAGAGSPFTRFVESPTQEIPGAIPAMMNR